MKPFRFRLESLLHVRQEARDACRVDLARAIAKQQQLQAELAAVEQKAFERRQADRELRQSQAFSLDTLRQSEALRQSFAAEQSRIEAVMLTLTAQVEICQQRLLAAECEYQAVAKLRVVRLAEHQRNVQREESKLADEAAGRAFRRAA